MDRRRKALVVLHGDRARLGELPKWAAIADVVIAADGGADHCLSVGVTPDLVVGDLDGISPMAKASLGDRVLRIDDQNTTDCQKALTKAVELGAQEVVLFGAEGSRIDHTLSAFGAGYALQLPVRFVFSSMIGHTVRGNAELSSSPGTVVSLIPMIATKVGSSSGLKWPVAGISFGMDSRDGVSNEALGDRFTMDIEVGCLLVFVGRHEGDIVW